MEIGTERVDHTRSETLPTEGTCASQATYCVHNFAADLYKFQVSPFSFLLDEISVCSGFHRGIK